MTREERKIYNYNKIHKIVNNIEYKYCTGCNKWFPMTEEYFYKWKYSKTDGYRTLCKECDKERSRKRKREKKEELNKKDLEYYYATKPERLKKMKEYKLRNPERWKAYVKQYIKNHPEKAKIYGIKHREKQHRITKEEWYNCKLYFNFRCVYCGLPIEEHWILRNGELMLMDLHKDHAIDDGKDNLSNCLPSCNSCNSEKHTKTLNEWYNKDNPKYTYERYHRICEWLHYDYKKYIRKRKPKQKYNKKAS
jgi:hypothetical protein